MTEKTTAAQRAAKQLAEEVRADFARRQEERRLLERGWQLNMNFLSGNQYCDVNSLGEIEEDSSGFFWQTKRVFNYIAPAIDMRAAKLARVRPRLAVRAASEGVEDRRAARISSSILATVYENQDIDGCITRATVWSETCGTAFYKIIWDGTAGCVIGRGEEELREGGVKIAAVSPFEIYPAALSEENLQAQPSILHAVAMSVEDIYAMYGVKLKGRDIDEFSLSPYSAAAHSVTRLSPAKAVKHGYETVIERYERPTADRPEGRLTIVAGDCVLFDGSLPYINAAQGTRGYPFVRQTCLPLAGAFFGGSVVDRLIPVQRAYNAVKNRKHEFLNRISMGTVAVEDGSVDTDELVEDGLTPGKVIVYRRGGTPPSMLTLGSLPSGFADEEDRLVSEFGRISGVGEISQNANSFNSVTSATGLQLLIEQDDERLNVSYEQIKSALKEIGRHILCLYRQFSHSLRVMRPSAGGDVRTVFSFTAADVCDDVYLEADSDINLTPSRRRTLVYDLIASGVLNDEDGKLSAAAKGRALRFMGYGGFAEDDGCAELHRARSEKENIALLSGDAAVKEYDDHAVHIASHTAYVLSNELSAEADDAFSRHIGQHKKFLKEEKNG